MSFPETLYTIALRAASPALPLLSRGEGKLARGVRGRRGVLTRMEAWARTERDPSRPLVWFHAPSVGEGLQAKAVMEALRAARPDVQQIYTFFSPSAEGLAARMPADLADYLPLDLRDEVEHALEVLRPSVLAFSKYDVWPNLTRAAARRGVRMALLSATLPAGSSRLRGPARTLLSPSYGRLDVVAAISAEDAERFGALGVPPERRTVMGDARFDQVWARARAVELDSPLLRPLRASDRITLVAGSTWPPDEERLVPAFARTRAAGSDARLILVPHEPTEEYLAGSEALLREAGLSSERLGTLAGRTPSADVVLVDRVGVLGELYALADVAYVGGGWGTAGIHSVLEPAALGAPVLFGPRHANAREAAGLVAAGGAFDPADERALEERLRALLIDPAARDHAGELARAFVQRGLGAAARGAETVQDLLLRSSSASSLDPSACGGSSSSARS